MNAMLKFDHRAGPSGLVRERRSIWELLVWTYRDQQAHRNGGVVVLWPEEAAAAGRIVQRRSVDGIAACEAIGLLGTRVDTSRASVRAEGNVHPDAETIHEVLSQYDLGDEESVIVMTRNYAIHGIEPDWKPDALMRYVPVTWVDDKYRKQVMICTETEPGRAGRGFQYCPVELADDNNVVAYARLYYSQWRELLKTLRDDLLKRPELLKSYEVTDALPAFEPWNDPGVQHRVMALRRRNAG